MNEVQRIEIDLNLLEGNVGQVEGVPANPRKQSEKAFRQLKKSLKDFPEFLAYREPLVVPHGGKYVVMCGNMRVRALAALGEKSCVCKILPTDPKKIREAIIKDNVEFGEWDEELLQGDWDKEKLADWGVILQDEDNVSADNFGNTFSLPSGEKSEIVTVSLMMNSKQAEVVKRVMKAVEKREDFQDMENFGNQNKSGNAIYYIVTKWESAEK